MSGDNEYAAAAAADFLRGITDAIIHQLDDSAPRQSQTSEAQASEAPAELPFDLNMAKEEEQAVEDDASFGMPQDPVESPHFGKAGMDPLADQETVDGLGEEPVEEEEQVEQEPWQEQEAYANQAEVSAYAGYQAQLEAFVTGPQLGQLLASSDFGDYLHGSRTLTVEVDEASVAALYAAAGNGASLQFYGGTDFADFAAQQAPEPAAYSGNWQAYAAQGWQQDDYAAQYQQMLLQQQYSSSQQQQQWNWQQQQQQMQQNQNWQRAAQRPASMTPQQQEDESHDGEDDTGSQERRSGSPLLRREKAEGLSDLFVVATKKGKPGELPNPSGNAASSAGRPNSSSASADPEAPMNRRGSMVRMQSTVEEWPEKAEEEIGEEGEQPEAEEADSHPNATDLQVRSVHLLDQLGRGQDRNTPVVGGALFGTTGLVPKPPSTPHSRPRTTTPWSQSRKSRLGKAAGTSMASRPTTVGSRPRTGTESMYSQTRPNTVDHPNIKSSDAEQRQRDQSPPKPDWDTSFYTMHERRIPRYDALLDENCPMMSSPQRLRHLIDTRELSDAHLHIVRARFEQHRARFDAGGSLGDQSRPVPQGARKKDADVLAAEKEHPDRLVERMVAGFPNHAPPPLSPEHLAAPASPSGRRRRFKATSTMLCSPDWHRSLLHEDLQEEVKAREDGNLGTGQGGLVPSWQKLEDQISLAWHRLQIPLDVRKSIIEGPLTKVTPDSVFRLQAHWQELQSYEKETKNLIKDWLQRDRLLQSICGTHTLGINDVRIETLKSDVKKLDTLSTSLVRNIGGWCRRFPNLIVDISRDPSAPAKAEKPRAIFQWNGRDGIERIQSDSEALARGDLSIMDAPPTSPPEASTTEGAEGGGSLDGGHTWSQRLNDWGFAQAPSGKASNAVKAQNVSKAQALQLQASGLAASTVAAQHFAVSDVLFEGPAPSWYRAKVAKAGIKALKRGTLCGGGDKRI
mmetsp:Transcript_32368/g.58803  ORF Transcript_32368/g.58803 Transcript_32368/m.58803 type:complete len:966 (-) Transcript_32368:90-2987(-)